VDFTVVVPTYNRPAELAGCLRSLAALDYSAAGYEVVIVDDGGTVDLTTALQSGAGKMPVRVVAQDNRGPGAARNRGAREARGRWLAFTDDDCRPRTAWLRGLAAALQGGHDLLVGGRTTNQLRDNIHSTMSQVVADAAYAHFNRDPACARFLASNNMGVWRDEFRAAGGFDEQFRVASEDREFCDRWRWRGGRIAWVEGAEVEHRHVLSLERFLRQHYAYGRGAARYHRTRRMRGSGRLWDDFSFQWHWGKLLLRPALATARPAAALALLACWQAANTAGFAREALRQSLGRGRLE
jgi:glycosyltransferase involved in cell wall biosynthesis